MFIANRAANPPPRALTVIDYFIEYETKDGNMYHNCTLLIPFSAWHHGMLERFPSGHKFASVVMENDVISFFNERGLICKHRIGVHIGPQITD